jgi:hypothetical protein
MADGVYSRPDKQDHAHTVLYEIHLLRFAKERLESARTFGERWVFLEAFLLHYRNLIEFFGKTKNVGDDDLSILYPQCIWPENAPDDAALAYMRTPALWEKYETRDNLESISKYLHHCTTHRTQFKQWPVQTMFEEIKFAIEKFTSTLPPYDFLRERLNEPTPASQGDGNSTAWMSTRPII